MTINTIERPPEYYGLLLPESPLLIQPTLAKALGIGKAAILQQMFYWLNRSNKIRYDSNGIERKWIYNNYKQWSRQLPWIELPTMKKHIKELEKMGILVTGVYNSKYTDRTKWYSIDLDKLYSQLEKILSLEEIDTLNKNNVDSERGYFGSAPQSNGKLLKYKSELHF